MSTTTTTTTIDLPSGPIIARFQGDDNDIIYARGIPYASAHRFQKPRPTTWTEPRDCTRPAVICPQRPSRLEIVNGDITGGRVQSEDCLHVTVAAPRVTAAAKKVPVLVFFHGGAYMSGGGDLDAYNPCELASKGGVVVVMVTYRLGHFGYLPIPGVAPANLGFFDQIEALRWVQKNVAAFGGDPGRVTVSGQSAGGDTVFCLLVCEEAKGLFHRAIVQSAPMGRLDGSEIQRVKAVTAMAGYVTNKFGSDVKDVSTKEYFGILPEMMKVGAEVTSSVLMFAPIFGEEPLPPESELKQRVQEAAKRVAVFIGYTADEGSAFAVINPSLTAEEYAKNLFQEGSDQLHEEISEIMPSPIYQFNWYPKGNKWGATHCIELPFLFGGAEGWSAAPMLEGSNVKEMVRTLGDQVKDLWVAFAKGSDLGGKRYVIDSDFTFKGP